MLRKQRHDPRPQVWAALRRQFWMTRDQVAFETGLPKNVVGSTLRRFRQDGLVDQMPGDKGKLYRKRRGEDGTDKTTATDQGGASDEAAEGAK